jgi:hypothetical protein
MLLLGFGIIAVITMAASGENSPPMVQVHSPTEGDALGLVVTVSGNATDPDGFNFESYVEARWNDWEWFRLPTTPANESMAIVFGEQVNLDFHAPGPHLLCVRAFDGELHGPVFKVNVTVRDLADLVILPDLITLDPADGMEGDAAHFNVVVLNQGGEDVVDVEVVLRSDGTVIGKRTVDLIGADSQSTTSFDIILEEGIIDITASVSSLRPVLEKSLENNEAQRTFDIPGEPAFDWWEVLPLIGIAILVLVVVLVAIVAYAAIINKKD